MVVGVGKLVLIPLSYEPCELNLSMWYTPLMIWPALLSFLSVCLSVFFFCRHTRTRTFSHTRARSLTRASTHVRTHIFWKIQ